MCSESRSSLKVLSELHNQKLEILKSGRSIIDLSMVNPDLQPERELIDKLSEYTIQSGSHRYTIAKGIKKLRDAFSQFYSRMFHVTLDPENHICVTHGSKDAFLHTLMAITKPGDKVLVGTPTYPAFSSAFKLLKLEVETFSLASEDRMLTEISEKIAGIKYLILNFPNNPTGISVSNDFYKKLNSITKDVIIINDFVYGELGFDGSPVSCLSHGIENKVEIYSLSKAYCVPGWRVGALLGDPKIVGKLSSLKSQVDYGIFTPLQLASAFALTNNTKFTKTTQDVFKLRYQFMSQELSNLGFVVHEATAGCSIWCSHESKGFNSLEFANTLLNENQIAILPGIVFGEEYTKHVRIALVQPDIKLGLVTDRIGAIINS